MAAQNMGDAKNSNDISNMFIAALPMYDGTDRMEKPRKSQGLDA